MQQSNMPAAMATNIPIDVKLIKNVTSIPRVISNRIAEAGQLFFPTNKPIIQAFP